MMYAPYSCYVRVMLHSLEDFELPMRTAFPDKQDHPPLTPHLIPLLSAHPSSLAWTVLFQRQQRRRRRHRPPPYPSPGTQQAVFRSLDVGMALSDVAAAWALVCQDTVCWESCPRIGVDTHAGCLAPVHRHDGRGTRGGRVMSRHPSQGRGGASLPRRCYSFFFEFLSGRFPIALLALRRKQALTPTDDEMCTIRYDTSPHDSGLFVFLPGVCYFK